MMAPILALSQDQYRDLWAHLLPRDSLLEQAAFLFCTSSDDITVFSAVEMVLLRPSDFATQEKDYLELTNECRGWLIKRAHTLGASLVEVHSHPQSKKIAFSRSDRMGLRETVEHMRWRLNGRPYIAVVVGPCGFDALVWTDSLVPGPLAGIRVRTTLYEPANASLDGWDRLGDRFDRNERLFGKVGQENLRNTRVAVIGVGGLGTHVVQQLALLGVGHLDLIDHEVLSQSNRNRYVGVWHGDPMPGSSKVHLGCRLAKLIDPSVGVSVVRAKFPSDSALKALRGADYVFGCVDSDGVRFVLNEACLAYRKPLFDLASDVPEPGCYGGRVQFVGGDKGCLYCRKVLDPVEVRRVLSPQSARENEAAVYGIDQRALDEAGPSVVSLNGVVASLGVTEFMAAVTGIRAPYQHLEYRGDQGTVRRREFTENDCYCCTSVRGKGDAADIARYYSVR